ncbi:Conserved membrane protein YqhR [Thalassobacillus cyri]|uniref:Conserved membrane protein YqhR n=1 Tax=Thalassobacillus cyri TaxID=571932 RepID=A0A1H4GUX1_9BACI|nr:YqhR family membrane protein [Thalassobacillus cyri]SEB12678.1 Conserved membrane protein YqhR [Thalassobacillus cyri]
MEDKQLEQNQQEKQVSIVNKSLLTGFVGGMIWSIFGALAYYFSFTEVSPASFVIRSFWQTSWSSAFLGEVLGIIGVSLVAIIGALVYYLMLKKTNGVMPGILYGLAIWGVIFYLLNPIFAAVPALPDLTSDTIVTTICLFVLYGTFVGYSISYEYHDLNQPSTDTTSGK